MKVAEPGKDNGESYGIEPLTPGFTFDNFKKIIQASNKPIKILLMDQEKIAGLGNIYAAESLFLAKINPLRRAKTLALREIKNLFNSIIQVIEEAIKHHGSSGKDNEYRQIDGTPGEYQKHFLVYQREGAPCRGCSGKIKREKQGGRSTFWCPKCQK